MKRMIVSLVALGLATLAAAEWLTLTVHTDKVTNTVGAVIWGIRALIPYPPATGSD